MPRSLKIIATIAAGVFAVLATLFATHRSLPLEHYVTDALYQTSPRGLGWWALLVTQPTRFLWCAGGLVLVAGIHRWRDGFLIAVGVVGSVVANDVVLKPLIGRTKGLSYCFPSGHASAAVFVVVGATLCLAWRWPTRNYWVIGVVLGALYVGAVSWWLVSKGYHYPADVVGSWCYGLLVATGLHAVHLYFERRWPVASAQTS